MQTLNHPMIVDRNCLIRFGAFHTIQWICPIDNRHFHSTLFDLSSFPWQGFQTLVVEYQ